MPPKDTLPLTWLAYSSIVHSTVVGCLVKRILFVCWANMDRSPTAEDLLRGMVGFEALSAGVWKHARRPVSRELIDWADHIFVMEEKHREAVLALKPEADRKMTVLHIPDIYVRNDPGLVEILKARLSKYLQIE